MEQDQVGFDAQALEILNALFEMPEELRVESREIVLSGRASRERITSRLDLVVGVVVGKHANAQFVERRRGEGLQSTALEFIALVEPCVRSGANRHVWGPVLETEVGCVSHANRSVIGRRR